MRPAASLPVQVIPAIDGVKYAKRLALETEVRRPVAAVAVQTTSII